jgi:hypothetical protein
MIHEKKIKSIIDEVIETAKNKEPIAFNKKSVPHLVPDPKNPRYKKKKIDLSGLTEILEIDVKNQTCTAESGVTFFDLVNETLPYGLVPMTVPELKGITIGGAVSGCSIESMSYKSGGFHDSCIAYEVISSDGSLLNCTRDNNNDIFEMIHGSYGTLGILTKLTFKLIPAKPFVKMTNLICDNIIDYNRYLNEHCSQQTHDFVDGIVYDKNHFVLCLGNMVDKAPYTSSYDREHIYYKSVVNKTEDYMTLPQYFFRYDTECHWVTKQVPFFENKLFRKTMGSYFLGSTNLIKWSKRLRHIYGLKKRQDLVVDVFIPSYNFINFYDWYEKTLNFYPLWIVPYKMPNIYPWVSPEHKSRIGKEGFFIDCAIYGMKNNDAQVDYSKLLEDKVFELNGVKTLIGRNDYTENRFWDIYNKPLYDTVKEKVDPNHLFENVYKKFHPHVK